VAHLDIIDAHVDAMLQNGVVEQATRRRMSCWLGARMANTDSVSTIEPSTVSRTRTPTRSHTSICAWIPSEVRPGFPR